MKAITRTQYGSPDSLQFSEMEVPTPAKNEVLVQVCAASVNPLDLFLMKGAPWNRIPGLRTPRVKILGCDIAGRVKAVGTAVTRFQAGDEVFGITGFKGNGFAEYVCAAEEKLAFKPANLSFEEAAALPIAATTALQGLRDKGRIQLGQRVLIEGASGGVGTFAIQIAKAFRVEVTAVCSARNLEMARSLGADRVINYSQVDFARSGQQYDLIVAANAHHSIFECRRALRENGIYVAVGGGVGRILEALLLIPLSQFGRKRICFFIAKINQKDLTLLADLAEAGKLRPVIDKQYPLCEAAEAIRYLAQGHAQGKVVLTIQPAAG